jgi:Protein of unknown function (DUF1573)
MIRQIITIAALLIVAIVVVSWVHAEYRGPGQLVFDDVYFDAGNTAQRGEVPHAFAFRNIGGKTVTITKITTTCSCTAAQLTKLRYRPAGRRLGIEFVENRKDKIVPELVGNVPNGGKRFHRSLASRHPWLLSKCRRIVP